MSCPLPGHILTCGSLSIFTVLRPAFLFFGVFYITAGRSTLSQALRSYRLIIYMWVYYSIFYQGWQGLFSEFAGSALRTIGYKEGPCPLRLQFKNPHGHTRKIG